eukprot:6172153-Pleurochrysis_carterae.AAC.1
MATTVELPEPSRTPATSLLALTSTTLAALAMHADDIRAAHADEEPVGANMPLALAKAMEDDWPKYKIEPQAAVLIFFKETVYAHAKLAFISTQPVEQSANTPSLQMYCISRTGVLHE